MSVRLDLQDREILYCKNSIISSLNEITNEIIEEERINLNQQMSDLLFKLDIAGYGLGFDLAEYLKKREDAIFFCELVKKTINRYEEYFPTLSPTHRRMLHIFFDELHIFALNLSNDEALK